MEIFGNILWILGLAILIGILCYLTLSNGDIILTLIIIACVLIAVGITLSTPPSEYKESIRDEII